MYSHPKKMCPNHNMEPVPLFALIGFVALFVYERIKPGRQWEPPGSMADYETRKNWKPTVLTWIAFFLLGIFVLTYKEKK